MAAAVVTRASRECGASGTAAADSARGAERGRPGTRLRRPSAGGSHRHESATTEGDDGGFVGLRRRRPDWHSPERTMPLRTKTRTTAPPVTATEVAVLGLLADGERSGYDLLRAAERSVGFFWTPAKTQLYAVLRKLVENGFATARHVRQSDRPDKTLYRVTDAGLDRLRTGLEEVTTTVNKNPLELRIF